MLGENTFTISAMDMYTHEIILQDEVNVTITPGTPTDIGILTDDLTPPFPMQAEPFDVKVIQVKWDQEDISDSLGYEVTTDMNNGTQSARVYGTAVLGTQSWERGKWGGAGKEFMELAGKGGTG